MLNAASVDTQTAVGLLLLLSTVYCVESVMQCFMHQNRQFIRTECCSSCKVEAHKVFMSIQGEV